MITFDMWSMSSQEMEYIKKEHVQKSKRSSSKIQDIQSYDSKIFFDQLEWKISENNINILKTKFWFWKILDDTISKYNNIFSSKNWVDQNNLSEGLLTQDKSQNEKILLASKQKEQSLYNFKNFALNLIQPEGWKTILENIESGLQTIAVKTNIEDFWKFLQEFAMFWEDKMDISDIKSNGSQYWISRFLYFINDEKNFPNQEDISDLTKQANFENKNNLENSLIQSNKQFIISQVSKNWTLKKLWISWEDILKNLDPEWIIWINPDNIPYNFEHSVANAGSINPFNFLWVFNEWWMNKSYLKDLTKLTLAQYSKTQNFQFSQDLIDKISSDFKQPWVTTINANVGASFENKVQSARENISQTPYYDLLSDSWALNIILRLDENRSLSDWEKEIKLQQLLKNEHKLDYVNINQVVFKDMIKFYLPKISEQKLDDILNFKQSTSKVENIEKTKLKNRLVNMLEWKVDNAEVFEKFSKVFEALGINNEQWKVQKIILVNLIAQQWIWIEDVSLDNIVKYISDILNPNSEAWSKIKNNKDILSLISSDKWESIFLLKQNFDTLANKLTTQSQSDLQDISNLFWDVILELEKITLQETKSNQQIMQQFYKLKESWKLADWIDPMLSQYAIFYAKKFGNNIPENINQLIWKDYLQDSVYDLKENFKPKKLDEKTKEISQKLDSILNAKTNEEILNIYNQINSLLDEKDPLREEISKILNQYNSFCKKTGAIKDIYFKDISDQDFETILASISQNQTNQIKALTQIQQDIKEWKVDWIERYYSLDLIDKSNPNIAKLDSLHQENLESSQADATLNSQINNWPQFWVDYNSSLSPTINYTTNQATFSVAWKTLTIPRNWEPIEQFKTKLNLLPVKLSWMQDFILDWNTDQIAKIFNLKSFELNSNDLKQTSDKFWIIIFNLIDEKIKILQNSWSDPSQLDKLKEIANEFFAHWNLEWMRKFFTLAQKDWQPIKLQEFFSDSQIFGQIFSLKDNKLHLECEKMAWYLEQNWLFSSMRIEKYLVSKQLSYQN